MDEQTKQLAEMMHTIYCEGPHSEDMTEVGKETGKCKFYLEQVIENKWTQSTHQYWLQQAYLFITLSKDIGTKEAVQDIISVYRIYTKFMEHDPKLAKYIRILLDKNIIQ